MAPYGYVEDQRLYAWQNRGIRSPFAGTAGPRAQRERLRELAGRAGVSLPAYFVAVLLGGGWLTTVESPGERRGCAASTAAADRHRRCLLTR